MDKIRFEADCDISLPHFHDEMELMYVLSGRTAVMVPQKNCVLGPEDFIIFNPFEFHEMYREAGSHTLSMFIPMDILVRCDLESIRCCSCIQQEQTDYMDLIRAKVALIFKNHTDAPKEQELYIISQLYGLLAILKQQFEAREEPSGRLGKNSKLREVMLYISRHFTEELTLQQVAGHTYLSQSHLSRIFKQQIGVNFSVYLRNIRLNKAEFLLRTTDRSVTDIALECGFANTNTMIVNFKEVFQVTPGAYRRQHHGETLSKADPFPKDKASYLRLLKYAASEESSQPLSKQHVAPTCLQIDIRENRGTLGLCHQDGISVGWARSLLEENVRNAVRRSVRDIGFRYITCHGLLDDALDVYHEDGNRAPWFSFTYIDLIVEFLVSTGLIPWIEFCFTPGKLREDADNLFGESYVQLPVSLDKWDMLVSALMKHLIENYGEETVKSWRFSILPAFYLNYGVFSMEDYLEYYIRTYRCIRRLIPGAAVMGAAFDIGFLKLDGAEPFTRFLTYCKEHGCLPSELCFQSFSCDYSCQIRSETEEKIRTRNISLRDEPAPPNADPDNLKHEIAYIRQILSAYDLADYPMRIDAWNSTIWQRDLGNDTCFKAAYIVKSFLENARSVTALNYCHLTDNSEQRIPNSSVYHGGNGLMTYQGIPKASYHAYCLLNRLGNTVLEQGRGYAVTRSQDGKKLQILLYHYCHYDMESHVSFAFPEDEQRTVDRYYEFADPGVRSFRIYLSGMEQGEYTKESYTVNREMGSSYDKWMEIGAPRKISSQQRIILENGSAIGYKYEIIRVDASGEALISAVLDAHEVRAICIEKK